MLAHAIAQCFEHQLLQTPHDHYKHGRRETDKMLMHAGGSNKHEHD